MMKSLALAILHQGGRVWLASAQENATRQLAETLSHEGPVDYFVGSLDQEDMREQLADLIYQTDGRLDVLVQLIAPDDTNTRDLAEMVNTTFFIPQDKGHIVHWAWKGENPQPSKAPASGPRIHALIAPPTEGAIPHILHLASPAAESLQETTLIAAQ
ncbi:MAG: hypothetical protein AB8F95_01060 [Bacteroidia bacterium]